MATAVGTAARQEGSETVGGSDASGLHRTLRRVRRRLRLARTARRLQRVAPPLALAALVLVALARLWWAPWAEPAALVVAVGGLAIAAVGAAVGRIPLVRAAWATDRALDTGDAVATALEFDHRDDPLSVATRQRAHRLTVGARPRRLVPVPVAPRRLLAAGAIGGLACFLAVSPNPQDAARAAEVARQAALDAAAAEVAAAAPAPVAGATPDAALETQLDELAQRLRDAPDLETAQRLTERTALDLAAALTPEVLAKKAAVRGLDRAVGFQPLLGFGNVREPESAATQLSKAAASLGRLSRDEVAALAGRLADLAEAQRSGNPELAQAMREASSALQRGDRTAAADALRRAAAAQQAADDAVGAAERRVGASQQLAATARGLASARQASEGRAMPGNGPAGNPSVQGGAGNGRNGNGNGRAEGAGTRTTAAPGTVTGAQGGNGSGESGAGTAADGASSGSEPIFTDIPFEEAADGGAGSENEASDQVAVEGAGGQAADDGGAIGRLPGPVSPGSAAVPAAETVARYQARATAALARPDVPPAQRAFVARYFDALARAAEGAAAREPGGTTGGNTSGTGTAGTGTSGGNGGGAAQTSERPAGGS